MPNTQSDDYVALPPRDVRCVAENHVDDERNRKSTIVIDTAIERGFSSAVFRLAKMNVTDFYGQPS